MDDLSRKVVGLALVLTVLVSGYLTVVQIVNGFKPDGFLESFDVKSLRK
jgi:hypothetical protein